MVTLRVKPGKRSGLNYLNNAPRATNNLLKPPYPAAIRGAARYANYRPASPTTTSSDKASAHRHQRNRHGPRLQQHRVSPKLDAAPDNDAHAPLVCPHKVVQFEC